MTVGEQRELQALQEHVLADEHLADLCPNGIEALLNPRYIVRDFYGGHPHLP